MASNETRNMRVTRAGYKYIGHYHRGYLEIVLEGGCCGVSICPKDEFGLFDLFLCFGIDPEDGRWINDLVGEYCRVVFDEQGRVKMIKHIVDDKPFWSEWDGGADNG